MDEQPDSAPFRLAHLSDTHLGYEAYPHLSAAGNNTRGEDMVRAFAGVVKDIDAWDPELVIHAGDVADRTHIPIRYMLQIRAFLSKLASVRQDGTRRQLVVIAGNHEQPRDRKEACFLELFRDIPGVHIATTRYEQITFDDAGEPGGAAAELAKVIVHALPHDELKTVEWDAVTPVEGHTNIVTAHGVAGGSDLYLRALGREFPIPTDVLNRTWDYGALGHWHKRTPVNKKVWYCGSPENVSFRDLRDNGTSRGYLRVIVQRGADPDVGSIDLPIRRMLRLPVLDADGLSGEEITEALKQRLRDADVTGAVVGQIVEGVSRERWGLVDMASIRAVASQAVHYEVTPKYLSAARPADIDPEKAALADVDDVLVERANELLHEHEREAALKLARTLLSRQLAACSPDVGDALDDDEQSTEVADLPADTDSSEDDAAQEPAA